jgi:hypothetical protein
MGRHLSVGLFCDIRTHGPLLSVDFRKLDEPLDQCIRFHLFDSFVPLFESTVEKHGARGPLDNIRQCQRRHFD